MGGNGFFGGNSFGGDANQNQMMRNQNQQYGGDQNGRKRNARVFVPVTMKMIMEAEIGPDDSCSIDNEPINEVSKCESTEQKITPKTTINYPI